MTIKAIIFDVDDTLINTSRANLEYLNEAAEKLKVKKLSWKEFLVHWGHPFDKMLNGMIELHWPGITAEEFVKTYNETAYKRNYPIIEGTRETLEFLKNKKIVLGILTSRTSDSLPKRFEQIGFDINCFKFIQYADDTKYHKPNPKVFGPILKKFNNIGIKNQEILYVGDHLYDAKAALGNKLNFLAVLTGTTTKEMFLENEVKEDNIISSIKDFKNWYLKNIKYFQ